MDSNHAPSTSTQGETSPDSLPNDVTSNSAQIRLDREFKYLSSDACALDENIVVYKNNTNIMIWRAVLNGSGLYKDGRYKIELTFCNGYPYKEPKVQFLTPIYHVNVSPTGILSPKILQSYWSPAIQIEDVIGIIQSILQKPKLDEEFIQNSTASQLLLQNEEEYLKTVAAIVRNSIPQENSNPSGKKKTLTSLFLTKSNLG